MFGNRAIQVSMTKSEASSSAPRSVDRDAVIYWNAVLIANAQKAAVGFVAVYGAIRLIDTASKIAIKSTPAR